MLDLLKCILQLCEFRHNYLLWGAPSETRSGRCSQLSFNQGSAPRTSSAARWTAPKNSRISSAKAEDPPHATVMWDGEGDTHGCRVRPRAEGATTTPEHSKTCPLARPRSASPAAQPAPPARSAVLKDSEQTASLDPVTLLCHTRSHLQRGRWDPASHRLAAPLGKCIFPRLTREKGTSPVLWMRGTGLEATVWEMWGRWQTPETGLRLHGRAAVQPRELYLPLGESQDRQSQPGTLISESAGHTRSRSAPKSETITRRLLTKTSSKCFVLQCSPNRCLSGHAGGWRENQGDARGTSDMPGSLRTSAEGPREPPGLGGFGRSSLRYQTKFFATCPELRFVPPMGIYLCTLFTLRRQEVVPHWHAHIRAPFWQVPLAAEHI